MGILFYDFIKAPATALLFICAAAAAMETLSPNERAAASFRALCALSAATCILREALRLLK